MASKGKRGKAAAAPKVGSGAKKNDWKSQHAHLFKKDPRDFGVGKDVRVVKDLSRYVKWPRYVRLQRQRAILKKRLKVPPAINQFSKAMDKNQATTLFKLLARYRPESKEEKRNRLKNQAKDEIKEQGAQAGAKPKVLKYGINHVTELVETKKAKLVVIAHDVDPLELVLWLPALCRKMDVPYCIVKGKARLGHLVYKKTVTAVAITDVRKEDAAALQQLQKNARVSFNDNVDKKKGGGIMGIKAQHVIRKLERAIAKENAAKNKM